MTQPARPHGVGREKKERRTATRGSLSAGLSFGAVSFLATTVIGVVTSVFIARLYGVRIVGQYALTYAPVLAAWLLSTVREQPAFQREAAVLPPRHPRVTALFAAVFVFSSGLTVVVALIAGVATYFVFHGPIHHPELIAPTIAGLIGYTIFTNTCVNFDSVFIAFRDGRQLFWLRLHQAALNLVLLVPARLISNSVWSLVIVTAISWALPCVHRIVVVRRWLMFRVSRAEIRAGFSALPAMLSFGLKLTPSGVLWGACDQIGTWVLGSLSSIAAVGAYNRAWFLSQRFLEARQRLSELLFPTLVERRGVDEEGFNRALIDSVRYTTGFILLFAAVGGGTAHGIMSIFGPGFERASSALTYLLLVPVTTTMVTVLSQALIATDRPLATSVTAGVRLITTVPLVLILTKSMGITGTALGMALGGAVQLICQLGFVQREVLRLFPAWWPARQLGGQLAAYAAGFLAGRAVLSSLPGYGGLALALVAGSLAYAAGLIVIGGVLPRDRARIRAVRERLQRGRTAGPASGLAPGERRRRAAAAELFSAGEDAERDGDMSAAETAFRQADELGHSGAACNLGLLLEERGSTLGAQAAYARADQRGDANGAFNLGLLLLEQSHPAEARAAFQRADQRGHGRAAYNLGTLLERQGNLAAAVAAYRRAEQRGEAAGAFNLGLLLAHLHQPAKAIAAFERAALAGGELGERAQSTVATLREDQRAGTVRRLPDPDAC